MPTSFRSRTAAFVLLVVALVGLILSGSALFTHVAGKLTGGAHESFCTIGAQFNCDKINASNWSTLFGTPIAVYGFIFYGLIFYLAFAFLALGSVLVADVLVVLTGGSVLYSVFLFFISKFFIGTLCLVCIGLYAVSAVTFSCAFILGRERRITERVSSGLKGILFFPRAFFTVKGASAVISTVGLIFFVSLFLGVGTLEKKFEHVLRTKQIKKLETKSPSSTGELTLYDQWKRSEKVDFQLSDEDGPLRDFSHGPLNAPVKIVEFSDLECPACKYAYGVLEELIARYPGKIYLVHKHFPLDMSCNPGLSRSIHDFACTASTLAQCGGAQGKFWETVDVLFNWDYSASPSNASEATSQIIATLTASGLKQDELEQCLKNGKALEKVKRDTALGQELAIHGTPSLWVNGKRLPRFNKELLEQIVKNLNE
jgi:protein-disulfide isomerase/uncharacterized membrane protein